MWIKLFLVITLLVINISSEISGLQNDFNHGYTYDPPPVEAQLTYYINIPAHQETKVTYYPQLDDQFLQFPPNSKTETQLKSSSRQFNRPLHEQKVQVNQPTFRPLIPQIQHIHQDNRFQGLPSKNLPINQHYFQNYMPPFIYQTNPSNAHKSPFPFADVNYNQGYNVRDQRNQFLSNQELHIPKHTQGKSTIVIPPARSYQSVTRDNSINVALPFPLGAVPIKFSPLPLRTHLRQNGLFPITSYQANQFYKK